jgi:hypothetical protein
MKAGALAKKLSHAKFFSSYSLLKKIRESVYDPLKKVNRGNRDRENRRMLFNC